MDSAHPEVAGSSIGVSTERENTAPSRASDGERFAVRGLLLVTAGLLPLVALIPGASHSFGLPRWALLSSCALFGVLHGTRCVYRDVEPAADRHRVRAELLFWCLVAAASSGPTPMVWVFPYLAALFAAQRLGRDALTCLLLLAACVVANLVRTLLWNALPAAAAAHSLAPAVVYWLVGGGARTALEERAQLQRLIAAEEQAMARRARLALARDIHDSTGALLVAAAMQTDLALRARASQPDRAERAAKRVHALMVRASAEARELEHPHPGSWEQALAWLKEVVHAIAPASELCTSVCTPGIVPAQGVWHALRCITSEAVNNAVRHADATQVHVSVTVGAKSLELRVTDDGRGLRGSVAGFGRRALVQRVRGLGGKAEWASEAGTGTDLRVTLPLQGGV